METTNSTFVIRFTVCKELENSEITKHSSKKAHRIWQIAKIQASSIRQKKTIEHAIVQRKIINLYLSIYGKERKKTMNKLNENAA